MSILGIVQARMGSKRLPKKMLRKLDKHTLFEWVVKRCKKASMLDKVILATSTLGRDDELIMKAKALDIEFYRGSEENLIERFIQASEANEGEIIVRICADNTFIDPQCIDVLIKDYLAGNYDYACNHQSRLGSNYPDGFGAEILSYKLLKEISTKKLNNEQKEHVTKYIWDNYKNYKILTVKAPEKIKYPNLKFDIDTQKDFEKIKALIKQGVKIDSTAEEIIEITKSFKQETNQLDL